MNDTLTAADDTVVLLDERGHAVGTADRTTVHGADTPLHLAFSCYVFDDVDRLLVTRRAAGKTFAGTWTNSFCGHPRPGEPLAEAVGRKAMAELGLALTEVTLVLPAFRYRAEQDGIVENEMCPVFVARASGPVAPDPAETDDVAWVDWDRFVFLVRSGDMAVSSWCRSQVVELSGLGAPGHWPAGPESRLPPAATLG